MPRGQETTVEEQFADYEETIKSMDMANSLLHEKLDRAQKILGELSHEIEMTAKWGWKHSVWVDMGSTDDDMWVDVKDSPKQRKEKMKRWAEEVKQAWYLTRGWDPDKVRTLYIG